MGEHLLLLNKYMTKMRPSVILRFIIFLIYVSKNSITSAQPHLDCSYTNNTNGNYTNNSSYRRNLMTLLSSMSSDTGIKNGFYNVSAGQEPDRVYGIALCRADLSVSDCRSQLSDATKMLIDYYPVQKEAIGYYFGSLMLRYSNRPIFRDRDITLNCSFGLSQRNIPEPEQEKLNQTLGKLLEGLKLKASDGNSSYKFSSGYDEISDSLKVYALTQCIPVLSSSECSDCLTGVVTHLEQCCSTQFGAGGYNPICGVQFANYPLITNNTHNLQPTILPPTPNRSANKRQNAYKTWMIIVALVSSFMLISILVFGISRRKMRTKFNQDEGNGEVKLVDSLQLDFSSIQLATDNFSDAKRLSNGSATAMYKGLLPDGQEIVAKKFHKGGRDIELEFDNEILLSSHLQHKNLVKLLGFCIEKDLRYLVYEFLPNGSLQGFLNDPVKRSSMCWQTRYHIINGLGRGLLYLHEDSQVRVIHRDLKPDNILLGAEMDPKISNFRTASLIQADQMRGDTRVIGTNGYMPLECVQHGHSSIKSDVFSYGVILLEIITGRMINGFSDTEKEQSLLTCVWRRWSDGNVLEVVDIALPNIQSHVEEIKRCVKIALLCVQEDPRHRPTISTVVLMLNSDTVDIAEPTRPSPLILKNMDLDSDCHTNQTDKSHDTSINEVSISYLEPR